MLPTTRLCRAAAVRAAPADGETVLLDLASGAYFTLNETGTLIWERLAAGATPEELATALAEAFAVAHEVARRDVDALVAELLEAGLVAVDA